MMNWLRKLVGLGGTAKNLTSLGEEECKEEIKAFVEKSNLTLFQENVQNLYSTQRIKETSVCPRCESKTEKKVAVFACATNMLPQIIVSTHNYFCTNCSSAIIDDKLLQKSCEKGKVYRGIIGFFIRDDIQTYQSLNEYIIRYHYDQNSKPSGIKITGDKIAAYDPKTHGLKGTKSQHKISSSPATLMDRVERRDKRESLDDSKFSNRNNKDRDSQDDYFDEDQDNQEQNDKAARSERARLAMENAGKKGNLKLKPKSKEDFADSVNDKKQDFKDKVEQKSNFNPKKKQKPVVENPNDKQTIKQNTKQEAKLEKQLKPEKQEDKRNLQAEANQEENKPLLTLQDPPARASQRKKQITPSSIKEEDKTIQQAEKNQNVEQANPVLNVEPSEVNLATSVETNEEITTVKKNRKSRYKNSTRKSRNDKKPILGTLETDQDTSQNEVKSEVKTEPKIEQKIEQKVEQKVEKVEPKTEHKKQQNRKPQPKKDTTPKQKEVVQKAQNQEIDAKNEPKQNENPQQIKPDNVIEKLHQNLQESSKASVLPKEEKPKEQLKESSRLARLKDEPKEEKESRRRPRTNVRPPIELDLKNVNPRRRYNSTKKK